MVKRTLMVIPEKHGNYYYLIKDYKDSEGKYKVALEVFNRRKTEGWYDTDSEYLEDLKNAVAVEPIAPQAGFPSYVHKAYENELKKYKRAVREYQEYQQRAVKIKLASEGNGRAALYLIEDDTDIQYETVQEIE